MPKRRYELFVVRQRRHDFFRRKRHMDKEADLVQNSVREYTQAELVNI
jgi:hypothetical protein